MFLSAADEARLYFALYVPLSSRQNVLKQGGLLGISRGDGAQVTTYADPFPVNGEEMSMAAYVMTYTEAGEAPFVGSFFPGGVMTSASHVVAGVPQLPGQDEGVMGLAIFAANSGELQDMILPEPGDDREISPFGFAMADDLLLVAFDRGQGAIRHGPYSLGLFRLNAP